MANWRIYIIANFIWYSLTSETFDQRRTHIISLQFGSFFEILFTTFLKESIQITWYLLRHVIEFVSQVRYHTNSLIIYIFRLNTKACFVSPEKYHYSFKQCSHECYFSLLKILSFFIKEFFFETIFSQFFAYIFVCIFPKSGNILTSKLNLKYEILIPI